MLADAIAAALPGLRAEAEAAMTSTCTIAPPRSEPTTDPETGEVTFPAGVAVYTGACRVRPGGRGTQTNTSEAGGAELYVFDYLISIPFAEAGVAEGHRLTITASPDPALVGVELEVQKVDRGEHITARRLSCNEVA